MEEKILVELAIFKPMFFKMTAQNMIMKDKANIISERAFFNRFRQFLTDFEDFLFALKTPILALYIFCFEFVIVAFYF